MGPLLLVLLLVVPVAELWVIVRIADGIGIVPTLLLLVLVSVAGAVLLKREGVATWRRMRETMRRGEMPTVEATDGALILLGGALLLTPGFLTDVVGLVLLFPASRVVIKRVVRTALSRRVKARLGVDPRRVASRRRRAVYEGKVVKVEKTDGVVASAESAPASQLPPPAHRDGEGGSPDTR